MKARAGRDKAESGETEERRQNRESAENKGGAKREEKIHTSPPCP